MISLGKIVKVRSNKGELVITPFSGIDFFKPLAGEVVLLKSVKYEKKCRVEYFKEVGGNFVIKFTHANTIADALKLVGYEVFASPVLKQPIEREGIVGFTVKDVNGRWWGEIVNIETIHLNKVLEIQGEKDIFYVPFNDTIVKEINETERIVLIDPPAGLRDLNR